MPSWSELYRELEDKNKDEGPDWLVSRLKEYLSEISRIREGRTVIFYASSFLQKRELDSSIHYEDMNGFMDALHGADTSKGLTLILHTPGGDPNAVESIVDYLHSKFTYIEVVVPYLAMSGGAMISLASNLIILGKQSQLGPIDPQLFASSNRQHSARAIQEAFDRAKDDITTDVRLAHLWAPILQNMGPSLILEAEKALSYSKGLVQSWLSKRMFKDDEAEPKIQKIANYFNAKQDAEQESVYVHGQRIGIDKLDELEVKTESLEDKQCLQDATLTAYHLMTLIFDSTRCIKFVACDNDKLWVKNSQIVPGNVLPTS